MQTEKYNLHLLLLLVSSILISLTYCICILHC